MADISPSVSRFDRLKSWSGVAALGVLLAAGIWQYSRPESAPLPVPPVPAPANAIKAPAGRLTTFKLPQKADAVKWLNPPQQAANLDLAEYADHCVLCPRAEGVYDLGAAVVTGGKVDVLWWRIESGKGPLPPPIPPGPGPQPEPEPKPTPTPTATKLAIIVIEETAEATLGRPAFFTDKALGARLKEKGHEYIVFDKDIKDGKTKQTPVELLPYIQRAQAKGTKLPAGFLVTPDGDIRWENTLYQKTPADLLAAILKAGG